MNQPLPVAKRKYHRTVTVIGSILLAGLLFLLIPLTQKLNNQSPKILDFRETVTIQPPQIITPPSEDTSQDPAPEPQLEFEQQLTELTLSQLELSLNPGIGDAIKIGVKGSGFKTDFNAVSNIQEMFTFADLQQTPTIVNQPRIQFPSKLVRRGIKKGRVVAKIEINEKGRAAILKIISSTSPELIPSAKSVIRQARFTPPKVNGKPATVQGDWPISLRAPN